MTTKENSTWDDLDELLPEPYRFKLLGKEFSIADVPLEVTARIMGLQKRMNSDDAEAQLRAAAEMVALVLDAAKVDDADEITTDWVWDNLGQRGIQRVQQRLTENVLTPADAGDEVVNPYRKCPSCGHIDMAGAFEVVGESEGVASPSASS